MRSITAASALLAVCKLTFSTGVLAFGRFRLGFDAGQLQTLAFVALAFGNQAILYVLRERGPMWRSRPGNWLIASSVAGTALVAVLAFSGSLMAPLPGRVLAAVFVASAGFALILDRIKRPMTAWFTIE
jgi:H+-transporting ATPase